MYGLLFVVSAFRQLFFILKISHIAVLLFKKILYNPAMMILRFTTKAFKKFGQKPQLIEVDKPGDDFGEWYVNTADSFNKGDLFMPVMHADSLYTMLVPIEKNMDLSNFVHTVFANLMLRMLRLEIPQECAEQIIQSYNGQAIFTKTKSRSLIGNLNNVLKDIDAMVEYCDDVTEDNKLDLVRLEYKTNETPRTLNGEYIWPLKVFYGCIRKMCPELPLRIPLPLERCSRQGHVIIRAIFQSRVPEKLLLKVEGSAIGAEVLFDYMEVQALLRAVNGSQQQSSDIPEKLYADLNRILSFKLQSFDAESA